jgi:uncharacterized SAM-binding protein YcdF (DUF218 family)
MVINFRKIFLILLLLAFLVVMHTRILTEIGSFLIVQDIPKESDAAVVLFSGVDIYPRLIEAADLYKDGRAEKVVINGNRKTDVLRRLESSGYEPPCKWHADGISVLTHQGVAKDHIIAISAENAFDTISEAEIVGSTLINNGMTNIIITTSKFHSRRARHVWKNMYKGKLQIYIAPAANDPFDPASWWKNGRQIRWVLSEYGAWIYYFWMEIFA